MHAETFDTFAEAKAALDEFFADNADEVIIGHWPPEHPEDYRILFAFGAPESQLKPLTQGERGIAATGWLPHILRRTV